MMMSWHSFSLRYPEMGSDNDGNLLTGPQVASPHTGSQMDHPLTLSLLTQLSYITESSVPPSVDIEMELPMPKVTTSIIPLISSPDPDPAQVQELISQVHVQEQILQEQIDCNAQLTATLEQEKAKILASHWTQTPKTMDVEMTSSLESDPKTAGTQELKAELSKPQQRIGLDDFYLPKGNQGFFDLANLLSEMRGPLLDALATSYQTSSTMGTLPSVHIALLAKFLEFLTTLNKNNAQHLPPTLTKDLPPYPALGFAWLWLVQMQHLSLLMIISG